MGTEFENATYPKFVLGGEFPLPPVVPLSEDTPSVGVSTDNVGVCFPKLYESRYLSGMLAGHMTQTDVIGYIISIAIPQTLRQVSSASASASASAGAHKGIDDACPLLSVAACPLIAVLVKQHGTQVPLFESTYTSNNALENLAFEHVFSLPTDCFVHVLVFFHVPRFHVAGRQNGGQHTHFHIQLHLLTDGLGGGWGANVTHRRTRSRWACGAPTPTPQC